ncbi:LPXTG cell wall anchor domain-containing protein [Lacticaseibacillus mingshuiensis]|uniref:LPXTG cell wall anchor domain-containing protein n=1 Tax=Lacticaseibacillus mingshuiensis TaxID=2799574 RepID=A0ABW4CHC9_9LACO|nr:LPXTG cell wall anchor domain-containing protein [Lacticaseibacillus mingshuiensis]
MAKMTNESKHRVKLYKRGRQWVAMGLTVLALGSAVAVTLPMTAPVQVVQAADDDVTIPTFNGVGRIQLTGNTATNPQPVTLVIEYIDVDNNNAVLERDIFANQQTGNTGTYNTVDTNLTPLDAYNFGSQPNRYQYTQGNTVNFSIPEDATGEYVVQFPMKQVHAYDTTTTSLAVSYTGLPNAASYATNATYTWNTDTNNATGQVVYTYAGLSGLTLPTVMGYSTTATQASATPTVTTYDTLTNGAPQDTSITFNYTADPQYSYIQYIDDDNNHYQVGTLENLSGVTDETINWTATVPDGYQLADGQAASGTLTLSYNEDGDMPVVQVHLTHKHTQSTMTTTNSVAYTYAETDGFLPAAQRTALPATQNVTVQWQGDTDEATGITTWTPGTETNTVTNPAVNGYHAAAATTDFSQTSTTATPADQTQTVAYEADPETVTVEFVDADGNVLKQQVLNGYTDQQLTIDTAALGLPDGYVLASGQAASVAYVLTGDADQTIQIHLISKDASTGNDTTDPDNNTGNPDTNTGNPDTNTGTPDTDSDTTTDNQGKDSESTDSQKPTTPKSETTTGQAKTAQTTKAKNGQNSLPQTGDETSPAGVIAGLVVIGLLFGFAGKRKHDGQNEA